MKKVYYLLFFIFVLPLLVVAGTNTTNYALYKPSSGETGWATAVNSNFDTVDSQMKTNADGIATNASAISGNDSDIETIQNTYYDAVADFSGTLTDTKYCTYDETNGVDVRCWRDISGKHAHGKRRTRL